MFSQVPLKQIKPRVEVCLHRICSVTISSLKDEHGYSNAPKSVNPLAQSEISSRTNLWKGIEKEASAAAELVLRCKSGLADDSSGGDDDDSDTRASIVAIDNGGTRERRETKVDVVLHPLAIPRPMFNAFALGELWPGRAHVFIKVTGGNVRRASDCKGPCYVCRGAI